MSRDEMDARAAPVPRVQVFSISAVNPRLREYKRRTSHRKSKGGCLACKEKRVKCDETRPACLRCHRNGRFCTYGKDSGSIRVPGSQSGTQPVGNELLSILSATTVVPFSAPSAANGTASLELMHHFQQHWTEILDMPGKSEILPLSRTYSHIQSTLLAFSASHLRHMAPGLWKHRIAEHFQVSLALEEYKKALYTPFEVLGQSGVDALILGAILLNQLAFTLPWHEDAGTGDLADPDGSWIFNPHEDRLGWLGLQAGLKPLMMATSNYLDKSLSFLGHIFMDENSSWTFICIEERLERVPDTWAKAFKLGECPNVYEYPIRILAELRGTKPTMASLFRYLQFVAKMELEFCALLRERDEKALWAFGYWLGLMNRFKGLWWCDRRVRRDFRAVRIWFDQLKITKRRGAEGAMWSGLMSDMDSASSFS